MLIDLGNGLAWDDSLAFDKQDDAVQSAVDALMCRMYDAEVPVSADDFRTRDYVWQCDGYKIVLRLRYPNALSHAAALYSEREAVIISLI
jgi:hypothetical protein